MNLLSTPSYVESPFIIVKIGDYTFGSYNKSTSGAGYALPTKVTFPNFMDSIEIVKINGEVNTYTIRMVYAITAGSDPNLLEKVFSTISKHRKIKVSYGDWASPSFIYKEEELLITQIQSQVDISSSKINYTLTGISTALTLKSQTFNFPAYKSRKPSDVIWELMRDKSKQLIDIFYGMRDENQVKKLGLIMQDDKPVKIEAKQQINVLDYLNYLVNCMTSNTNVGDTVLKDSRYYLTIVDSITDELPGPYFKIVKVTQNTPMLNSLDTFEVDIGYPGDNLVTAFNLNDNQTWSILFDYSQKVETSDYIYKLNDNGILETIYSPNITTSRSLQYSTEVDKTWWTNMTTYPRTATMTIKGLIRPKILMSYVKINVWFYGVKHISSGLYFITKQQDTIDRSGYRTTLSLTRVGGQEV